MINYFTQCSIVFFIAIFCTSNLYGQKSISEEVKKLPSYLNSSNAGTEYYVSIHPVLIETLQPTDGCYLYIASGYKTKVTIENEFAGTSRQYQTKPNDCIRIDLDLKEIQVYVNTNGNSNGHPIETVYPGKAIKITSNDPIIVYACVKISFTSDAFLVLPTSSWGKEYVVDTYESHDWTMPGRNLASMCTIVAGYDSTTVSFTLVGNGTTETVGGMKIGETKQFIMNKGDVVAVASSEIAGSTLAGSRIASSKPIGVISGVQCADVPSDRPWCDYIIEMELPVSSWGNTYHLTKNFNRSAGPYFQVVAKEPNTTIYVNGIILDTLGVKNLTNVAEWKGYNFYGNVWSADKGNIVVNADKPISVTMFNQGQSLDNIPNDPFQTVCYPIEQYRNEIIFTTLGIGDGKGFKQNFVNIVYPINDNNEIPDDLQWGEIVADTIQWSQMKTKWGPEHSQLFEGLQNGKKYAVKNIELISEGVYHLKCSEKIACYSYGTSNYDSYGLPSFMGLKDISINDVMPPDFVFSQFVDGSISGKEKGEYASITDMSSNPESISKLSKVLVRSEFTINYEVEVKPFVPGEDKTAFFKANVIDKSKDAQFVISTFDKAGNDTTIVITYLGTISSVNESELTTLLTVSPNTTTIVPITIEYTVVPNTAVVSLELVSLDGRKTILVENSQKTAGKYSFTVETSKLTHGMYYIQYSVDGKLYQKRFVKM